MKDAYVTALTESILTGTPVEQALQNVKTTMAGKGHLRLWPQVLKATKRVLESRLDSTLPHVTLAKAGDANQEVIKSALAKIGVTKEVNFNTSIDPNLVGGLVVRFKGLILDTSYKQALLRLYKAVSKS